MYHTVLTGARTFSCTGVDRRVCLVSHYGRDLRSSADITSVSPYIWNQRLPILTAPSSSTVRDSSHASSYVYYNAAQWSAERIGRKQDCQIRDGKSGHRTSFSTMNYGLMIYRHLMDKVQKLLALSAEGMRGRLALRILR